MMFPNVVRMALAVTLAVGTAQAQAPAALPAEALTIVEPWSRATPSGARVGVGYLVIENRSAAPDRLLAAESDVSATALVHETVTEAGVVRMKPVDGVVIAPNGRLELKPGVLASEGLEAALDELVAASDVPATLTVRVNDIPDAPAMAAYATVVAALDAVEQPPVATQEMISVVQDGGILTVRVEVTAGDGIVVAPDCTDAADRVGALGGHLTVSNPAGDGTLTVTAVIPCGS